MKKTTLIALAIASLSTSAFAGPNLSASASSNAFPLDNYGANRSRAIDQAHSFAKANLLSQCQAYYKNPAFQASAFLLGYTKGKAFDEQIQRKKGPPVSYRINVTDSAKCEHR